MLKYLLDINICIFTIKKRLQEVREVFRWHHGQIYISAVTLMELIYNVEKSSSPERNLLDVEGLATRLEVIKYDKGVAVRIGQLRAELTRLGKQIGPYDQMTVEHAHFQGLTVVTNNRCEFGRVPGLKAEDWAAPVMQLRKSRENSSLQLQRTLTQQPVCTGLLTRSQSQYRCPVSRPWS